MIAARWALICNSLKIKQLNKLFNFDSRDQGSRREVNEEERLLRLFVMVPKSMPQKELEEVFSQYGDIDYVSIVKDHETKASKGFAYIKYHRSVPV